MAERLSTACALLIGAGIVVILLGILSKARAK